MRHWILLRILHLAFWLEPEMDQVTCVDRWERNNPVADGLLEVLLEG